MADPVAAAGGGEHVSGMPQLDFSTFPNQIFWLVVSLVVIWWIVTRIALPRLSSILAERAGTISNDVTAAEEIALKVKEAEAAYDRALADARAEAGRIAAETRAAMQSDLDEATAEADRRIEARTAESTQAIAAIRADAAQAIATVARDAAGAIVASLGGEADGPAIDAAVAARVGELSA